MPKKANKSQEANKLEEANTIPAPEFSADSPSRTAMADNVQLTVETGESASMEDLHNQMAGGISGVSLIHLAAKNQEDALAAIRMDMAEADDDAKELLERQLEALELLSKLAKDEGRKEADRFLSRKNMDDEQAANLLRYLQNMTQASEVLGRQTESGRAGRAGGLRIQNRKSKIGRGVPQRACQGICPRGQQNPPIVQDIRRHRRRRGERAWIWEAADPRKRWRKMTQQAVMDVQKASSVHDIAEQLMESSLTEKDSLAELRRLGGLLEEMDGFAEEQARLAELSKDDVAKKHGNHRRS